MEFLHRDLVERDLLDAQSGRGGLASIHHTSSICSPRDGRKLGCDMELSRTGANLDTGLRSSPSRQSFAGPKAVSFCSLLKPDIEVGTWVVVVGECGLASSNRARTSRKLHPEATALLKASAAAGSSVLSSARLSVPKPASEISSVPRERAPTGGTTSAEAPT